LGEETTRRSEAPTASDEEVAGRTDLAAVAVAVVAGRPVGEPGGGGVELVEAAFPSAFRR
jgi:hypothetical protein